MRCLLIEDDIHIADFIREGLAELAAADGAEHAAASTLELTDRQQLGYVGVLVLIIAQQAYQQARIA
jgi:hypothetical protein